ncbi:hypothetical protein [Aeromonas sp. QDB03]|uniref:hypothetical protein n=1 Tax=Aeromonas sp. QDB03 TaxID=2989839 RepID=UPI0022E7B60B|nr:hypothetical protein [Aeromonas sp. QDB03]
MQFIKFNILKYKYYIMVFCIVVIITAYALSVYMPPFRSFFVAGQKITIDMREVDVSLAFGRKSDCPEAFDGETKTLSYAVALNELDLNICRYDITLRKGTDGTYRVKTICFDRVWNKYMPTREAFINYEHPKKNWSNDFYVVPRTESEIIEDLGHPSYTSIDAGGTLKIISYSNLNVAFMTEGNELIKACISNELPQRFANEYKN